MEKTKKRDVAVGIIKKGSEIYFVREFGKTHYKLPGGFVDDSDKDYEAAVRRELYEELDNIEIIDVSPDHDYLDEDKNYMIHFFNVTSNGEPKPKEKIEEISLFDEETAKENNYLINP